MGSVKDQSERTVYVSRLAPDVTDDLLYELFLQTGPLEAVDVLVKGKDGRTVRLDATVDEASIGDGHRYALVRFAHDVSVPFAVEVLNGVRLCGAPLDVRPKAGSAHARKLAESRQQQHRHQYGGRQQARSEAIPVPVAAGRNALAPPPLPLLGRQHHSAPTTPAMPNALAMGMGLDIGTLNAMAGWAPIPPPPPAPPMPLFHQTNMFTPPMPMPVPMPMENGGRYAAAGSAPPAAAAGGAMRQRDTDYRRQGRHYDTPPVGQHRPAQQRYASDGRAHGRGRDLDERRGEPRQLYWPPAADSARKRRW